MRKRKANKKGIYFSIDGILASMLIIGVTVLLLHTHFYEKKTEQRNFITQDIINILSEIKISEINNTFVQSEIANGNITDINQTALEQIGGYWALNKSDKAKQLFESIYDYNNTDIKGMILSIENDVIYNQTNNKTDNIVSTPRIIAGISKGNPLTGYSSSAYLKKIQNKKSDAYAYLGGFIGQGNITFVLETLPSDINQSRIENIELEGDFGANFKFFINDFQCNKTTNESIFYPIITSGIVNKWNITNCSNLITSGINNLSITFLGNISQDYVAGGLMKVTYRTDTLFENITSGSRQYNFPGIIGVANLYDSFYIPGTLLSMDVGLHFKSGEQTYLSIGEKSIEIDSTGADQWEIYNNTYLLNVTSLDYNQLSLNTIPLRFAAYNATTEVVSSGDADVILITDFSGSMKKAVSNWDQGHSGSNCDDVFSDPKIRRTNLAKCVDNEFVDTVMNYSGNRIWPVFIYDDAVAFYDNPEDKDAIKGYINSYSNGKGKTCLSCALNKAYDILSSESNSSRTKFIVLMTDGTPTHCPSGSCTSTSTTYGTLYCEGLCDTTGSCDSDDIPGQCTQCINNQGPVDATYYSANRSVIDHNATIYTVGFGPVDDCSLGTTTLNTTAQIGNGSYQHSSNMTELRLIYQNISQDILTKVTQTNQSISVKGNLTPSNLYNDSYINFTYTPISAPNQQGAIYITMDIPITNCNQTIELPQGITLEDAKVTSYSGTHWTDVVIINNYTAFNLSNYYVPYYRLGDAFILQIPINQTIPGNNNLTIETGDSPTNRTGCSENNTFIYSGYVPAATLRSEVKEKIEGCEWTIKFEDGDINTIKVPLDYNGTKTCSYQPGNISYDSDDTYDVAVYNLLYQLDMDDDGEVLVNINKFDLEITTTTIGNIPYLWGPSLIKLEIQD